MISIHRSKEEIAEIVDILLVDIKTRLAEEGMTLNLTEAPIKFLVEEGYDEKFGARPLKRAIQRFLEDALSEKILMAEFGSGDEIEADIDPEGVGLTLRAEPATKT